MYHIDITKLFQENNITLYVLGIITIKIKTIKFNPSPIIITIQVTETNATHPPTTFNG